MRFFLILFFIVSNCYAQAEQLNLHLVGNAHIDLAYRWRWNETVDRVTPDTFEGVLRMMEIEPSLTFAQSQMALYEEMQYAQPDLFKRVQQKIKEGKWSVVGGQWAEPDAILTSGESLIRQFLIGSEYMRKNLGVQSCEIAWVPDSFCGQAYTLPKIYRGCGIKYYMFGRGAPDGMRIFNWQSDDGSSILAYKMPKHYNLKIDDQLVDYVKNWYDVSEYPHAMVLYGEGDHGGGPREPDLKGIKKFKEINPDIKIDFSTPEDYFNQLEKSDKEWPNFSGEMGIGVGEDGDVGAGRWRGSYTSQARIKKANRDMENLLLTAERFATIGSMLQRKPLFPRVDFREAWKLVLKNQFHDILPGTSIGDVFDDAMNDYRLVKQEGERLLTFGLEVIGSRIDTRGKGIPLVIYNPNSWERTDVVRGSVRFIVPVDEFNIKDSNSKNVIFNVDGWSEDGLTAYISFLAKDVPPIGYSVYRVFEGRNPDVESDLRLGPDFMVNDFYKVEWNNRGVTMIYDKKLRKNILNATGNIFKLTNESTSSSWDLMLTDETEKITNFGQPQIIERSNTHITVLWQNRTQDSFFTREVTLKAGVPRVEFKIAVDWHEHDKILQVHFPTKIMNGTAMYEQPYGHISRPTDGVEWPAQNWIDLSNKEYGVALLNNGKYGFNINKNKLSMSIVRGARDMDPRMDEGIHSINYAIYSHEGDWKTGDVTQTALELNQPMLSVQENHHTGSLPQWGSLKLVEDSLPSQYSFFNLDSDHVIISAIKIQQGDWSPADVVVRVFETEGREDNVTLALPAIPRYITETNHIEDPLPVQPNFSPIGKTFSFNIKPNQIKTFLIHF